MPHGTLMDEDFPARIEASFPDHASAVAAAQLICQRFKMDESQLSIGSQRQLQPRSHRNSFMVRASRHRLHRRQLLATIIAFALIGCGFLVLHVLGVDNLSPALASTIMGGLLLAAVAITIACLFSWRPVRLEPRHRRGEGDTALVVHVHDISEQYAVREALRDMGASVEGPGSAGVA